MNNISRMPGPVRLQDRRVLMYSTGRSATVSKFVPLLVIRSGRIIMGRNGTMMLSQMSEICALNLSLMLNRNALMMTVMMTR